MNKQKLATAGCIVLSIVFTLSLGLLFHFKVFLPHVCNIYEKALYYPEELYEEYQEEAERMLARHEYTSQYPTEVTFYSENGRTTLIMRIGESGYFYSNYITVTVKNFGTNEQEVTFDRSRESSEWSYEQAERYRDEMSIGTWVVFILVIVITVYLIKNSIKRNYRKVFETMVYIIGFIATIILGLYLVLI